MLPRLEFWPLWPGFIFCLLADIITTSPAQLASLLRPSEAFKRLVVEAVFSAAKFVNLRFYGQTFKPLLQ